MPRFDFKDPLNPRLAEKPQVWQTPFIRLANRIPPSYRIHFVGVTVDHRLGYTGRRQFHSLAQALTWAESMYGDSWSNKRFTQELDLHVLLDCTSRSLPQDLKNSIAAQLRRC